jgi:ribosomal subunit interface protein
MQSQLQIAVRDMAHSAALDARIRRKVAKLEQFFPRITACRVVIEAPHRHKQQGRLFSVRLDISVPGSEFVVNREDDEDVYVALRDAFSAARRQLAQHGESHRHGVRGDVHASVAVPEKSE